LTYCHVGGFHSTLSLTYCHVGGFHS
jgi:hypothetical protein